MFETRSIGLDEAMKAKDAIFGAFTNADNPGALCITDAHGVEVLCARADGAPARMLGRARAKAYTAARVGMNTVDFRDNVVKANARTLDDWGDPEADDAPGRARHPLGRAGRRRDCDERQLDDTGRGVRAHRPRSHGGGMMAAYLIADVQVHDPETFSQYSPGVAATLEPYGGRFLARGGAAEIVEGDFEPTASSSSSSRTWTR